MEVGRDDEEDDVEDLEDEAADEMIFDDENYYDQS